MKKLIALLLSATILFSSCGTIFGGRISACQKTKPAPGQMTRQIRPAALTFDLISCIGLAGIIGTIIDFADGGIYKPCNTTVK